MGRSAYLCPSDACLEDARSESTTRPKGPGCDGVYDALATRLGPEG